MISSKYKKGDIIQHNTDSTLKRKIIDIYFNTKDCCKYIEDIYYQTIIIDQDIPPTQMNEASIDKYYKKIEPTSSKS
jgi:hypothetical protein